MRCWPTALVFLVSFAPSAFAQNLRIKKGLELFNQQRYNEALQEFEAARAVSPGSAPIENALGITCSKLRRLDEANQHYAIAIRLDSKLEDPHKNLGFNYLIANQYVQAEKELMAALALNPDDPYPHFYLGMLYLATSSDKDAVEQVKPAWPLLANDPGISFQMAKACARMKQGEEAIEIVNVLWERSSISVSQERELATLLFEKGLYPQAAQVFHRVSAVDSKSLPDRYNLAIALLNAGQTSDGASILESLAVEQPNDASLFSILGSVYENANKTQQALEAYKKEILIDPQESDRYLDYTRVLMESSRYQEAEQFVRDGLKVVREPYPLYMRIGSVQMMAGKYDEARTSFQKAITEHPDIPVGYVALAQCDFKDRHDERAAQILESARQKLKPDYLLEYYYGLALDRLGQKEQAAVAIERAIRLNSTIPDIHFELGRVYYDLNRMDAARLKFEKVIEANPQHAKAYFQLSRIYFRLGNSGKAHEFAETARQLKQAERETPQLSRARNFQLRP